MHAFKWCYVLILRLVTLFAETKMLTLHLCAWKIMGAVIYFQNYLKLGHTTFIEASSNILNIRYLNINCKIPDHEIVFLWKVEIA